MGQFLIYKKMRTSIFIIIVVVASFLTSCSSIDRDNTSKSQSIAEHNSEEIVFSREQAEAIGLKTEIVKTSSFQGVVKTGGQILPSTGDEQTVVATSAGIVSFANASIVDGSAISSGETIVYISAKNLQDGDPTLKAKIAYEIAEKEYKRAENLVKDNIISVKQFEQSKLNYENTKAAFQGQASNITSSGVRVVSPINGFITNRLVKQGEYVSMGQPIATIIRNKHLQLRAEVSESYFRYLKGITSANFKTSYDNKLYKLSDLNGQLISYGKSSNGNPSYVPVTFEFEYVENIIPGSFSEVYLLSAPHEDVISVPISALTEEQGLNYIYVQVEPDAFVKREVVVGENNGERIVILKGLDVGDMVVVKGVIQVKLAATSGAIPDGHSH